MPVKYDLTVQPRADADIPDGDGYYTAQSIRDRADDSIPSLSVSMLYDGAFRGGDEPHTKRVFADDEYRLRVAATRAADEETLDAALAPVLNGEALSIDGTAVTVTGSEVERTTLADIRDETQGTHPESIAITFETPTCIVRGDAGVTEMFPHRRAVFGDLRDQWNAAATAHDRENLSIDTTLRTVVNRVFEKPEANSYRTFSTLTNKVQGADGELQPFFRQGFIGDCTYGFREGDADLQDDLAALVRFAEFAGVGADTAHGCGCVTTDILDTTRKP